MSKAFSNKLYIQKQKSKVLNRIKKFDRLYLEFGGQLVYDNHASRVLPGYKKTTKIELLKTLIPLALIYCVNARDLQSNKTLTKNKRTYQKQVLKDLRDIKNFGINVHTIVLTRYQSQKKAREFKTLLEKMGRAVFTHHEIKGYPHTNVLSGFSKQPYIPIENNLVVITGPAGGSGKMAVALSQIYHETKQKKKPGFAKFETFPVWNLDLNHPINIAYEAATADLQDKNLIDPYHKKYYNINSVNYNRDIENYKILKKILQKITKKKFPYSYKSPTDMGMNEIKQGIVNDDKCRLAAIKEIKRRKKAYIKEYKKGRESYSTIKRMEELIKKI